MYGPMLCPVQSRLAVAGQHAVAGLVWRLLRKASPGFGVEGSLSGAAIEGNSFDLVTTWEMR